MYITPDLIIVWLEIIVGICLMLVGLIGICIALYLIFRKEKRSELMPEEKIDCKICKYDLDSADECKVCTDFKNFAWPPEEKKVPEWEKEFDKKERNGDFSFSSFDSLDIKEIKQFISEQISKAKKNTMNKCIESIHETQPQIRNIIDKRVFDANFSRGIVMVGQMKAAHDIVTVQKAALKKYEEEK